jgi:glycerol-3-phosphate O-acyltransferase/dihydroxyacetone phosphate acyltransferase
MDVVKKVEGRIYFAEDDEGQLRIVRGVATAFCDSSFQIGGSIHVTIGVQTIKLEILSINGPEKLVIKKPPGDEIAQLMTDHEGFDFKVSPKMDQTAVYEAVFDKLKSDGCVGIFPEGGSHDRTDLLSLQGGWCLFLM